jgi:hypothetical protein
MVDRTAGSIRLRDSSLHIDPTGATRPLLVSRTTVMVAHAGLATDAPYGSLCTISEPGLDRVWRILSDVELTASSYNAPDTTDMAYDFYMAPEQFTNFLHVLGGGTDSANRSGISRLSQGVEYQATRYKGFLFALKLMAWLFGSLLVVGSLVFLLAELFPEYEEDAVMVLVGLIPFVSFGVIRGVLHARGPSTLIRISRDEVVISRTGRPEGIAIVLFDATALKVNWVASGRYGRRKAGPAFEFLHGQQQKTRIALSDPQAMWEGEVVEISEPHYVVSRQAWEALVSAVK